MPLARQTQWLAQDLQIQRIVTMNKILLECHHEMYETMDFKRNTEGKI